MPFAPREVFDPRITVARSTPGGRRNSAGIYEMVAANMPRYDYDPTTISSRNLLTYSEFQNGLPAVRGGGVVIGDFSTFPGFDTGLGITSDNSYAYKQTTLQPNTTYTLSVFVRMADGTTPIMPSTGASASNDFAIIINSSVSGVVPVVENFGYGVYRVSQTYTTPATTALSNNGVVRYSGQSSRNFLITGYQLNKGTVAGDYMPTLDQVVGNAMARGIIVEEQKTNYVIQSENQTVSPWSGTSSATLTKVLDNSGPGGLAATTFTTNGATEPIWGLTNLVCTSTIMTFSFYIKKNGTDNNMKRVMVHNRTTSMYYVGDWNPANGGMVTTQGWVSEAAEDGWYLCTLTLNMGLTVGDGLSLYTGMVGANSLVHNFKVAAPQAENGSMRTSYIPTTTAAVLRAADLLTVPVATLKYKQTEGTLIFDGLHATQGLAQARIGLQLGDDLQNRQLLYSNNMQMSYVVASNAGSQKAQGMASVGGRMKGVLSWDSTGYWTSINGAAVEFVSFSLPQAATKLWIGSYQGGAPWNGIISGVEYWPRKLTPAQMLALSTL